MKKHYNMALTFLNEISINEIKKQKLIAFTDSLMVREV
jgi:hypothetical protein